MIQQTLFKIPYWSMTIPNFEQKKKQLVEILKNYPEIKIGLQTFSTNRQSNNDKLAHQFTEICGEEFRMLSNMVRKDFQIDDIWSVSYEAGEYHSPHNHGSTGLTGILYLQMDNYTPLTCYIQPWNDYRTDTTSYSAIPVMEGTIVVVPKFVQHFSPPNTSKTIKRIISWDMSFV